MVRAVLLVIVAFILGALASRPGVRDAALAAIGIKIGHERAYAEEAAGRREVPCDGAVLLVLGQSNAANTVRDFLYEPRHQIANFNALDGKCYAAEEPLLGMWMGGYEFRPDDGSIWTMVADRLPGPVTIAPIALVGSSVADWSEGYAAERLSLALAGLKRAGLTPSWIVWHQGETDAEDGMSGDAYAQHFEEVVASIRQAGIDTPIFVALATVCRNFGSEEIRAAQAALPQHLPNVKPGPDADQLTHVGLRYDGCHFSTAGAKRLARLWVEALRAE